MDAVTKINDTVKRFVVDGTASHLPISVVAYTVLPQMVLNFNLRLSNDNIGRRRQEHALKIYSELNRQYLRRYDVSHVTLWVSQILHMFELSVPCTEDRAAGIFHSQRSSPGKPSSYMLELQPALYFKLASIMDVSMATGHLTLEYSEATMITPSAELSMPPLHPELAVMSPTRPQSTSHQLVQSRKNEHMRNTESCASGTLRYPRQNNMSTILGPSISSMSSHDIYTLEEDGITNSDRLIPIDPVSIDTLSDSIAFFGE